MHALMLAMVISAEPVEVEMVVRDVIATEDGTEAVLLSPVAEEVVLPIFVGPAEGNAIRMKLNRQTPPRPMTHDLLDTMIRTLGGKVQRIYIDDLKRNTFLARIYVLQGGKTHEIDARPSDSIALALRCNAPIFTARKVIDEAGITRESLEKPATKSTKKRLGPGGAEL